MWKKMLCLFCLLPVVASAQRGSQGYTAQLYQGQSSFKSNQFNAAAYHFRSALEWDQDGVDAHIGLGKVYLNSIRSRDIPTARWAESPPDREKRPTCRSIWIRRCISTIPTTTH